MIMPLVDVHQLEFGKEVTDSLFEDSRTLHNLALDILYARTRPDQLPPLIVQFQRGVRVVRDGNRRLKVYKSLAESGVLPGKIPIQICGGVTRNPDDMLRRTIFTPASRAAHPHPFTNVKKRDHGGIDPKQQHITNVSSAPQSKVIIQYFLGFTL